MDIVKVIVEALPFLKGWVSQAQVVVTALPAYGAAALTIVQQPWFLGILGAGLLGWTYHYVQREGRY